MTSRPQPSRAYLTLSRGPNGQSLGTVRLVLRDDVVPRTVSNFKSLLTRRAPGEGYSGSRFHRIIPNFMAQGGDFTRGDGTGGRSVYGETFPDENFTLRHDRRGVLSMANSGPDTNGSQFFLCFRATPHLDGRHVAFGHVDMDDEESVRVLEALEAVKTGKDDRPIAPVTIEECGVSGDAEDPSRSEAAGGAAAEGTADADEDEIDLDDEGGEGTAGGRPDRTTGAGRSPASPPAAEDDDEIDLAEDEVNDADDNAAAAAPKTKKEALKERLRRLKMKMNQSRQLNRREVRNEGERLGSEEGMAKERKRQSLEDRKAREREWANANGKAAAVAGGDVEVMSRQAMYSVRKAARKAAKAEANRFGANDYHNPEGQHRNYERSLRSLPPPKSAAAAAATGGASEVYDPTLPSAAKPSSSGEADGAKRLAAELKRRGEKAQKRKEREQELDFEATDVSYVNKRNRKFNEKIGRMFDKHTAEIRQNLERGTAL